MDYQDAIIKGVAGLALSGVLGYVARFIYLKNKYKSDNQVLRYDNEVKTIDLVSKDKHIDDVISDISDSLNE